MPGWLQAIVIAVAVVVASWLLLIVLARRLPAGLARDLARFLPDCVAAARVLRRDPRVPRRVKIAVLIAVLWVVSPIDLIPEFLPVIGPLDDVVVVALALRFAVRQAPVSVVAEAWPGSPAILDRILGRSQTAGTGAGGPPPSTVAADGD
jgi:uncharacterized membrane protein YkvA (DUF1232 family)